MFWLVIPISLTRFNVKFELVTICVTLFNIEITRNFFEDLLAINSLPWARQTEDIDDEFKVSIVNSKLFQLSPITWEILFEDSSFFNSENFFLYLKNFIPLILFIRIFFSYFKS